MTYDRTRDQISQGMKVRALDGDRLGKVVSMQDSGFVIEKGLFFPKDYYVPFDAISDVRDDEIWISMSAETLKGQAEVETQTSTGVDIGTSGREYEAERVRTDAGAITQSSAEEGHIPLYGEELDVQKRQRQVGAVEITKDVETRQETVSVPVRREEVHVEEVPASSATSAAGPVPDDFDLERGSSTVSVPLMGEEVEVTKRPVVKGEVRVTKTVVEEQRNVTTDVKEEKAKIDRQALDDEERRRVR